MQVILAILVVGGAAAYVLHFLYKNTIAKRNKCEGCAVHKLYQLKLEKQSK